jgi:hypothetical protein
MVENDPPSEDYCPPSSPIWSPSGQSREILQDGIVCAIAFTIQSIVEGIAIYVRLPKAIVLISLLLLLYIV